MTWVIIQCLCNRNPLSNSNPKEVVYQLLHIVCSKYNLIVIYYQLVCLEKVGTVRLLEVQFYKLSQKPLGTRTSVGRPVVRFGTGEAKILQTGQTNSTSFVCSTRHGSSHPYMSPSLRLLTVTDERPNFLLSAEISPLTEPAGPYQSAGIYYFSIDVHQRSGMKTKVCLSAPGQKGGTERPGMKKCISSEN